MDRDRQGDLALWILGVSFAWWIIGCIRGGADKTEYPSREQGKVDRERWGDKGWRTLAVSFQWSVIRYMRTRADKKEEGVRQSNQR